MTPLSASLSSRCFMSGTRFLPFTQQTVRLLQLLTVLALAMVGLQAVEIVTGPVAKPSPTNVVISWTTDNSSGSRVHLGVSKNNLDIRAEAAIGVEHRVVISDLKLGTRYYYSVGTARLPLATNSFITSGLADLPEPTPAKNSAQRESAAAPVTADKSGTETTPPLKAPPTRKTWVTSPVFRIILTDTAATSEREPQTTMLPRHGYSFSGQWPRDSPPNGMNRASWGSMIRRPVHSPRIIGTALQRLTSSPDDVPTSPISRGSRKICARRTEMSRRTDRSPSRLHASTRSLLHSETDHSNHPLRSMPNFCLVCGFQKLKEPPRSASGGCSYEICPCCGFQYGVDDDDKGITPEVARAEWVAGGMKWKSRSLKRPKAWDPAKQVSQLRAIAPRTRAKRT
ncbi:MAG: hypothetical protein EXS36_14970 [Pedosphaera sp.]|nr:hypothetical protein [Pedosphaera sp.]